MRWTGIPGSVRYGEWPGLRARCSGVVWGRWVLRRSMERQCLDLGDRPLQVMVAVDTLSTSLDPIVADCKTSISPAIELWKYYTSSIALCESSFGKYAARMCLLNKPYHPCARALPKYTLGHCQEPGRAAKATQSGANALSWLGR